jgi:UDP-3-O-[3-hydroxymyristoyl] glucosamine N-acyltransferase
MRNKFVRAVKLSTLSKALMLPLHGQDRELTRVDPISDATTGSLSFLTKERSLELPRDAGIVVFQGFNRPEVSHLKSPNPRLSFVRALAWLNAESYFARHTETAKIHSSVRIGEYVSIGKGVEIGEGSVVMPQVVIHDGVKIGRNCVIKSGAVIGLDGFGFERDEESKPIRFLHLGGVVIGDDVEIGSFTTVCSGALQDTVIEDHVKIDDHVHVAHGVHLGKRTIVTACSEISGGVSIGEEVWIAPQVSIKEQLKIGSRAYLGLAAVVIRDVADGQTVVGNPARVLEKSRS